MTAHVLTQPARSYPLPAVAATYADGPGKARTTMLIGMGSRTLKMGVYSFAFGDVAYTTNGESISAIWDDFPGGVNYIGIEQMDTNTEGDQRRFAIDYTAKKLLAYSAYNTEDDGTPGNLDPVTLRLFVVGNA
jgi:hypothetical protein